jgi:hypothetical protein
MAKSPDGDTTLAADVMRRFKRFKRHVDQMSEAEAKHHLAAMLASRDIPELVLSKRQRKVARHAMNSMRAVARFGEQVQDPGIRERGDRLAQAVIGMVYSRQRSKVQRKVADDRHANNRKVMQDGIDMYVSGAYGTNKTQAAKKIALIVHRTDKTVYEWLKKIPKPAI